ncbi:MAG: dynamin family protein [Acidimicrobiia bacterium]
MARPSTTSWREVAARLTEHGVAAAEAFDRADLAERLRALDRQAAGAAARVLVVGEFKQGKTSLVNALVGADVCPVDPDAGALVPVAVGWGAEPGAVALVATDNGVEPRPIDLESVRDRVVEDGHGAGDGTLRGVEITWPSDALRDGLVLVDFPDVGGLGSFGGALALAAVAFVDGVLFVSDAGQELTAPELRLLRRLAAASAPLALVKSRTDIHPEWRRVLDGDRRHAARMVHASFAVSSDVYTKGRESGDGDLVGESAIPDLLDWLTAEVVQGHDRRRAIGLAREVEWIASSLEVPLRAERAAHQSPAEADLLATRVARAQEEADRLRSAAGRWRQVLVDAFADLSGDLDHDLRAAARRVLKEAEAMIDGLDPARDWERCEPELRREVAGLVADHYAQLGARVAAAGETVARVFSDDAGTVQALVGQVGSHPPGVGVAVDESLALRGAGRRRVGDQALTMLRSSYGGALLAGFVGGVLGLAVATPAVLAAGVALGAKGLRDENRRQVAQRRAEAKTVARKLVDDVVFAAAKDSRDAVRIAERRIRDFFTGRADELAASAAATLRALRDAADRGVASNEARLRDIEAELGRLTWLVERCRDVQGAPPQEAGEP